MLIEVVTISADGANLITLDVEPGTTAGTAASAAGIALSPETGLARWGAKIAADTVLVAGDRLEVAAPLICDPKKVRQARALSQGDVRVVTCGRHGGRRRLNR